MNAQALASFVWSIAELLRGDYKPSEYGKVILPFTIFRRLDCVLEPTKAAVLAALPAAKATGLPLDPFLLPVAQQSFYNTSALDFKALLGDPANIRANAEAYVNGFSENARDIFENYEFEKQLAKLDKANLLYLVVQRFAAVDLHPNAVSNADMGGLFEELIRRFAELSNETAGDHFTPREVIRLMVNALFEQDIPALSAPGTVRSIYDPTAGTGGMLSVAEDHLHAMNPNANLAMHGQEFNEESYAICKGDMLVKGQDVSNIVFGNTLTQDGMAGKQFDYMLSNPPFGVDWKKVEDAVRKEHETKGYNGRFGPGLPRISDGSLLFLLHLISKMRPPEKGGSRIGIVLNGSPLFAGGAGSGESEIRRFVFEHDLCEAIIALPTDMFYNTGIATYVWILSNKKTAQRKGKIQLIDGSMMWRKMRKSMGNKRKELSQTDIANITRLYREFAERKLVTIRDKEGKEISKSFEDLASASPTITHGQTVDQVAVSRIFERQDFAYSTITVEHPLRLIFEVSADAHARLQAMGAAVKKPLASADVDVLAKLFAAMGEGRWSKKADAEAALAASAKKTGVKISAAQAKAAIAAMALKHREGEIQVGTDGKPVADPELRETENVPERQSIDDFMAREVLPYDAAAWFDASKTKVGYEVPFTRIFHVFRPPRDLSLIEQEIAEVTKKIALAIGAEAA